MRVVANSRPVVYIAADRPRQAQRSFARTVKSGDRELLNERLVVWPGPLLFDVGRDPDKLVKFALERDAGTVFLDSLGNVALDLTKDEFGSRVNYALQSLVAAGIEVCTGHHQRKGQDGKRPKRLEDVYGSRWITAGCGSVFLIWGEPGDLVVDLNHLKQPSEEIGPLKLVHDHEQGATTVVEELNLMELAAKAGAAGLLVAAVASLMFDTDSPDRNQVEKARRRSTGTSRRAFSTVAERSPSRPLTTRNVNGT
jgi:replicative DNA helicase